MKKYLFLILLSIVLSLPVNIFAVSYTDSVIWTAADGYWMTQANWLDNPPDPNWTIPGWVVGNPLNTGYSTDPDWNGGFAHIDTGICRLTPASKPDGTVRKLYVGKSSDNATLNISGDLTVKLVTYLGYDLADTPVVTINHTAGDVVYGNDATLSNRRAYFGCGGSTGIYNLSGGTMTTDADYDNFGYNGVSVFTFNQTGGTYTDTGSGLQIGYNNTASGTVNLSGGTFNALATYIWIGKGVSGGAASGTFNQTGGVFNAHRIIVSDTAYSTGLIKISGGELYCDCYWTNRNNGKTVVSGSGAAKIDTKQFSLGGSRTLGIELDGGGSTLIEVTGLISEGYHGAFLAGGTLEVKTIAGFNGQIGDVYDILWSAAELTTDSLTLNNLTNASFIWRVVDDNGGKLLQLVITDPEPTVVESPFTIVALPDTQYYSESYPATFTAQTQWIVDNAAAENIAFATHLGDVVDNFDQPTQWANADAAMNILDGEVAYSVCIGNHDYHRADPGVWTYDRALGAPEFLSYFSSARYDASGWYGGAHRRGLSHYQMFYVGDVQWIHLNLEFQADNEILLWAQNVLDAHPNSPAIISTHSFLSDSGLWAAPAADFGSRVTNGGQAQFTKFVTHNDQVFMILNGHHAANGGVARLTSQNNFGHDVFQLCSDYQSEANGGNGYLRTYEFDLDSNQINVKTYSPTLDQYKTDPNNQFALNVDFNERFNFSRRQTIASVQAANISVVVNDIDNTPNSVTVSIPAGQSTDEFFVKPVDINDYTHSNGDYYVKIGDVTTDDLLNGILITCTSEITRPDHNDAHLAYHTAEAAASFSTGSGDGEYWIAVSETSQAPTTTYPGGTESDCNVAAVYFPFSGGWTCGRVESLENGQLSWCVTGSDNIALGVNLTQLPQDSTADCNKPNSGTTSPWSAIDDDRGVWNLTIPGVDSIADGVLLVCGAHNENNFACASPWPDSSGWQIALKGNNANGGNTESDPFSFVYIPYDTEGVVAGRIGGTGGTINGTGGFYVELTDTGTYALYIDGYTPQDGALIISSELEWYGDDDITVYRAEGDHWIIENRDLPDATLTHTGTAGKAQYAFAFIPFDNAPSQPGPSADFAYMELLAGNFEANWDSTYGIINVQKLQGSPGYDAAWHNKGVYYQTVKGAFRATKGGATFGTVRQFSRNDGDFYGTYVPTIATREHSAGPVGLCAPFSDYSGSHGNGDCALVWMPAGCGYTWGDITDAGVIYTNEGSPVTITPNYQGTAGRYKYVFSNVTPDDGVLITIGRTNYNAMTSAMPLADGWEVTCRINESTATQYHAHWARYAFFPYDSQGRNTVARIAANGSVVASSVPAGKISVTKTATGTYTVDIFGASPDKGVLLLNCYTGDTGTGAAPCFLAYEPDGDSFTVKCFTLDNPRAASDKDFALVYVPFDRMAFFDGSGVNFVDFASFALSWLMNEADEDYNPKWDTDDSGTVDTFDLETFASCWLLQ